MLAFQRDLESFGKHNAQVLGVSGDTLQTHQEFTREFKITFPLIEDPEGAISKLYGGGRITYLIDESGTIRHIMKGVPDNQRLLEELDKFSR